MCWTKGTKRLGLLLLAGVVMGGMPGMAQGTDGRTAGGQLSIALIADALAKADRDTAARDVALAYIAGVVEASMAMNAHAQRALGHPLLCKTGPMKLDAARLMAAFHQAAPDPAAWVNTAATPVIVELLVQNNVCN